MPTYEYRCTECGATFEQVEHIAEHERAKPRCPKCNSRRVGQVMAPFYARTSRKT